MSKKRKIIFFSVFSLFLILFIYLIYMLGEKLGKIISPVIMAVVVAYLLNPLVLRLRRRKIPCCAAILLIYAFFLMLVASVVLFIIPELSNNTRELMNTLPDMTTRYQNMLDGIMLKIKSSNWSIEMKNLLSNEINSGIANVQTFAMNSMKKAVTGMLQTAAIFLDFVVAMIIAYYLIKDAEIFKETALSLVPRSWRRWITGTGREINAVLSNFIQGQILTALIVGIMEAVGLFAINAKYALVLGLVGGIANIIPYFGPFIGAIPAVAVALIDSPSKALWTALVFIIVQQIDNAFISPKIIEGRLGLHPVTTILAVLVGGELFGIIGMLVSVPVLAIIRILFKRSIDALV